MPKTPKSVKEATPRNLKMVSIDFFGAQKPKKVVAPAGSVTPTAKPVRNTALERLAKKAEERDNQAKGSFFFENASFYRFLAKMETSLSAETKVEQRSESEPKAETKSSLDELAESLNSPES